MTHTAESEVMQSLQESERLLASGAPDTPCYIYERSQSGLASAANDTMVTYIIIIGEYHGENVRIYYSGGGAGLGRTVTFMLRRPWEFSDVEATRPSASIGGDFSIGLELPSGLAEAQFPLIITFESDKQNIYSLNGKALTVATGRSGFAGATTDEVIYYEWRIEWSEYVASGAGGAARLDARFRMNTTSAQDRAYDTAGVDAAGIEGREPNDGGAAWRLLGFGGYGGMAGGGAGAAYGGLALSCGAS